MARDGSRPPARNACTGGGSPERARYLRLVAALSLVATLSHNAPNGEPKTAVWRAGVTVEEAMSKKIYEVPAEWKQRAFIDDAKYRDMYARSLKDPDAFWAEQAERIHWTRPFRKVKDTSFGPGNVSIKWFEDGVTNVAYNCIDRHLATRGDQVAIIWEGDDPKD